MSYWDVLHRFVRRDFLRSRERASINLMKDDPRYSNYQVGDWTYGEPEIAYWDVGATLRIGDRFLLQCGNL